MENKRPKTKGSRAEGKRGGLFYVQRTCEVLRWRGLGLGDGVTVLAVQCLISGPHATLTSQQGTPRDEGEDEEPYKREKGGRTAHVFQMKITTKARHQLST
jgi:hypothetical protein